MSRFYSGLLTRDAKGYLTRLAVGSPVPFDFTNVVVFDTESSELGGQDAEVIHLDMHAADFVGIEKRYNQVRGVTEALLMLKTVVPVNGVMQEVNAYTSIMDDPNRTLRASKFLTAFGNTLHSNGLRLTFSLFSICEAQFRGLVEEGLVSLDAFYSKQGDQ